MAHPSVSVSIVTCNSDRYIRRCLDALLCQNGIHLEVVVVDNASSDGTRKALSAYRGRVRVIRNDRNVGFAAAQNQAIRRSTAPWVLALNPDVLLTPGFLQGLLEAGELHPRVGARAGARGPGLTRGRASRGREYGARHRGARAGPLGGTVRHDRRSGNRLAAG